MIFLVSLYTLISLICHPRFYSNRYLLAKDGLHLSPKDVEVLLADNRVIFNRVIIPIDNLHQTNASYCLTSQDGFSPLNSVSVSTKTMPITCVEPMPTNQARSQGGQGGQLTPP